MKTIWKYELKVTAHQFIPIGDKEAKPIAIAEQGGKLVMWVELNPACVTTGDFGIRIDTVGTGHSIETNGDYLGTILMRNGLVLHFYVKVGE